MRGGAPSTTTPPATTTATTTTTKSTATTTTPPPTTAQGATIVIGVTDKVTDLDPANAYDFFTWEVLYNTMEGLVKYKPGTLEIVPALAQNWTVSSDGTTWTFKLRPNLKFSDGTPLTAYDVVRSVKRVMNISGDPSWLVTSFVKDVEAPDAQTVVFHLKIPCSYFLSLLATPPYFPVNPKYPNNTYVSDALWGGAGPYKIASFTRDQELDLVPNPYYYGTAPSNSKVIIRFYKDASTMRMALLSGEIDIAWRTLLPADIAALRKQSGVQVIDVPSTFIRYLVLNVNMTPTNNVLVRQAIAAAINRTEIINTALMGAGTPLYSLIPTSMSAYVPVFKTYYGDGNTTLARQLLTQAGYSSTNKLQLTLWYTPTHYGDTEANVATLIKQELEATGMISVTLQSAEWGQYVQNARSSQMGAYLMGWYPDYLDPDDYTTPFLHTGDNKWLGNQYSNPQMDNLLEQAQVTVDEAARNNIYAQVQNILAHDVPIVPLFEGKLYIVASNSISGIVPSPTMILMYNSIVKTK
ncbi:MAG TPA: peptide ABC transporter substrate-binding protein [Fervidicoccus fontis]|uniref:Peptide ABC transporter substrate-binding protein n=1 Tax=Fervidicoccus fontis TaxID=683846 RepID=A0A7C2YDK0_9CREN|nr:peptide ABC transporter substrate-binding protein [Fervidicoccus fontis]